MFARNFRGALTSLSSFQIYQRQKAKGDYGGETLCDQDGSLWFLTRNTQGFHSKEIKLWRWITTFTFSKNHQTLDFCILWWSMFGNHWLWIIIFRGKLKTWKSIEATWFGRICQARPFWVINATLTSRVSEWAPLHIKQTCKMCLSAISWGCTNVLNLANFWANKIGKLCLCSFSTFLQSCFSHYVKGDLSGGEYKESWPWPLSSLFPSLANPPRASYHNDLEPIGLH